MADPIPLRAVAHPVNPEVVDRLREVLAMAERGEVIAVGICTVNVARETGHAHVIAGSWAPLVACVASLQHRLMRDAYGD